MPETQNDALDTATDEDQQDGTTNADDAGADQSGDEKDWQAEYRAQQKINRDLERRSKQKMRELEAELAEARKPKPAGDDEQPYLDAIRDQIKAETRAEAVRESALDKLEAKAARTFQNPDDARAFLASRVDEFIDGNTVDLKAITDALSDLLEERPYLGVTQGDTKRFQGTADGGPKGTAGKPQLTREDVKRMNPAQINAAREAGQLNNILGITT